MACHGVTLGRLLHFLLHCRRTGGLKDLRVNRSLLARR